MSKDERKGYYQDKHGNWLPDRRVNMDRRAQRLTRGDLERRRFFRRKADRELYEKDHKRMINEALEDFAEEHDGRI